MSNALGNINIRPVVPIPARPSSFQTINTQTKTATAQAMPGNAVSKPVQAVQPKAEPIPVRISNSRPPERFKPQELKVPEVGPVQAPEISSVDPRGLKPKSGFEEMFFKPKEIRNFRPAELVDVDPKLTELSVGAGEAAAAVQAAKASAPEIRVPQGQKVEVMDLPDQDTYRYQPRIAEISPRVGEAYRKKEQVIHTFSHDSISHWHYHYNPVPADDVQPPRNRSIVLPRKGGILNQTG